MTTLAEVKEQVLKYIPVMARPLVLLREQHPIRWTGVYADIEVSINYLPQFQIKHPETWPLANTNELVWSSKTKLEFMQNQNQS